MGQVVTLDFETAFKSKGTKDDPRYTLSGLTYEEYIFDPRFKIFGCGIKVGTSPSIWYTGEAMERKLQELFGPGNQNTAIAHNGYFDFAILGWIYNLHPHTRLCTMSMSKALWPHEPGSLDKLTKRLFPTDPSKWKGKELMSVDGLWELTEEQESTLAGYCNQDVEITFDAFAAMYHQFPKEEFLVIDMTLEFFSDPLVEVDEPRVLRHIHNEEELRADLLRNFSLKERIAPDRAAKILSSNEKYAEFLEMCKGITPPTKNSVANPEEETWAFAKDDIAYQELQKQHPDLNHIWEARKAIKSTQEISRANRLLIHSRVHTKNRLAVPIKYCGAHTTRWSGMNSINVQNFKRGGELRKSLVAPDGMVVIVADLSNIESRMLAWVAEDETLLSAYANKRDIYSEFASKIFGRHVDRKRKEYDAEGNEFYPDELEGFIGKIAILGLGYGMGWKKFQDTMAKGAMGGPPVFFEDYEAKRIVELYRSNYYPIPLLWRRSEGILFQMCMRRPEITQFGCCEVGYQKLILPNGLALHYPGLKYDEETSSFSFFNGKYRQNIYGGLFVENIIQALSRVLFGQAAVEINREYKQLNGRLITLTHDETVGVVDQRHINIAVDITSAIMSKRRSWCDDKRLVLASEVKYAREYSK